MPALRSGGEFLPKSPVPLRREDDFTTAGKLAAEAENPRHFPLHRHSEVRLAQVPLLRELSRGDAAGERAVPAEESVGEKIKIAAVFAQPKVFLAVPELRLCEPVRHLRRLPRAGRRRGFRG